jgi:hypothetical protein
MVPMTPEQATEILQRVTRIETMCEGRCATAHESREDLKEEVTRLRGDMERGQDRLEAKIDRLALVLAEKTDDLRERQWRDRLKIAGGATAGSGVGAALMWVATKFFGGQ